uniref:F-box domain-containing protein n=1 Tax=Triticum urartu TaxID=4572 RepID=A0A8R7PBD5_TRIUA
MYTCHGPRSPAMDEQQQFKVNVKEDARADQEDTLLHLGHHTRLTPGEARAMSNELLLLPLDAPVAKPPSIPSTATTTTLATAADGTTTISSLGQDQLLEIFLLLPSLPALVRATLTCRLWLGAVCSFRNLFRALHPAPLIGIFLDVDKGNVRLFAPFSHSDPGVNKDITLAD